ncbi:hypothetical protein [Methanotorris igneus]|uniref:Uncharacterized protein n=1 Tax=Methanotorris igneus (strain DSM 5666 / JCM 11834 / Kol 5) TaxID=880724 RepID=F6BDE7_METIK|nr:hypothetical protein [Methanotorris igneus]AEF96508.1 hypothetical protein Metig_0965 [Methanotorris igneus Kol 5]
MIFDSDIVIAVIVLLVGLSFYAASLSEHVHSYTSAVKTNILYDKASHTLLDLVSDGTLESCIILYNNECEDIANNILRNRINFKNYELTIGNITIKEGSPTGNEVVVSSTILLNRTEGWYGIYGNETKLNITQEYFLSESAAMQYLNETYNNSTFKRAFYYFNTSKPIEVKLKVYGG